MRKAIASWSAIDRALTFSSSKPFGPFSAVAQLPSAGIAMLARVAVIRSSPTTRVEIGTAPSVKRKRVSAGWQANCNICRYKLAAEGVGLFYQCNNPSPLDGFFPGQ